MSKQIKTYIELDDDVIYTLYLQSLLSVQSKKEHKKEI